MDQVPSHRSLLVPQTHVPVCPAWLSPPGSLSCPVTVTRHPPSHSPPPWEFVSPPSGPISQHRLFHQPPDPYPTHDSQVPTTALSQPIVCPSWGLVQSHLANN